MPGKNLHDKEFDSHTIDKLEIFENYAQAWLPTFVMKPRDKICIFDFFAGPGYDRTGEPGSPIRLLRTIKEQIGNIRGKNVKIFLYLNEYEPNKSQQNKFNLLKESCGQYLKDNPDVERAITIEYFNKDFKELFDELYPNIKTYPSLVYLDQNGIKFLANEYLLAMEKTRETDFLYFVSSSYFVRFGNQNEFNRYFNIDLEEVKKYPYQFIHRILISQLRNSLPKNSNLKLYPFSLRKKSNIYGIIFGASHPRAVDKFLQISWKTNAINGEANFDIDSDEEKLQLDLFNKKLTKIELFQETVREKILKKEICNNIELFIFTIDEGHIGKHAADCLKKMKRNGEVKYEGRSPLVTYEKVYKNKIELKYRVINT